MQTYLMRGAFVGSWLFLGVCFASMPGIQITSIPGALRVEVTLPQYSIESSVGGYSRITLPGWEKSLEKGMPELPRKSLSLPVPRGVEPRLELLDVQWDEIKSPRIEPSLGDLLRSESIQSKMRIESVDYGNLQNPLLQLNTSFIARERAGLLVELRPFQFESSRGMLRVAKKFVFLLRHGGMESDLRANLESTASGAAIESASFSWNPSVDHALKATRAGRILLIGTASDLEVAQAWIDWKRQRGFEVEEANVDQIGRDPQSIYTFVKENFERTHLTHLVLLGGQAEVPTMLGTNGNVSGNEADPTYALVSGEDSFPDLFVSRFPTRASGELAALLAKSIRYESGADDGDWNRRAAFVGSNEGTPTDWQRLDLLRNVLGTKGFDVNHIFYDPQANLSAFTDALASGIGFVNYTGHGSETSWVTTGLSNQNLLTLQNGNLLPLVVSVACVNGVFRNREGFGERWIKGNSMNEGGAIAIFASSTNQSWVPPTIGQAEIARLIADTPTRNIGELLFSGSIAVLRDASSSAIQTFQSWHIFGDGTADLRTGNTTTLSLNSLPEKNLHAREIRIPLPPHSGSIRGTLTSEHEIFAFSEAGASENELVLKLERDPPSNEAELVLSGPGLIPVRTHVQF